MSVTNFLPTHAVKAEADHHMLPRIKRTFSHIANAIVAGILLISPIGSTSNAKPARELSARAAFDELAGLVGNWRTEPSIQPGHSVSYRLSANGTALVETWTLSATRESVTIYTLDGSDLIAAHFCPQGNQPRLKLVSHDAQGRFDFRIIGGTNLNEPGHELLITAES